MWIDAETRIADAPADHHDQLRLWLRLFSVTRLIENEVRSALISEFDTTFPRFDLLSQLYRVPDGLVLGELSKRLMVSPGNITSVIERLVDDGYVTRTQLPTDRRVHTIRMTERGKEHFVVIAKVHEGWIRNLTAGLDSQEITTLMQLLQKLKGSVHKALE
jgi:DNA-binding MarR family transcriptional regulator